MDSIDAGPAVQRRSQDETTVTYDTPVGAITVDLQQFAGLAASLVSDHYDEGRTGVAFAAHGRHPDPDAYGDEEADAPTSQYVFEGNDTLAGMMLAASEGHLAGPTALRAIQSSLEQRDNPIREDVFLTLEQGVPAELGEDVRIETYWDEGQIEYRRSRSPTVGSETVGSEDPSWLDAIDPTTQDVNEPVPDIDLPPAEEEPGTPESLERSSRRPEKR